MHAHSGILVVGVFLVLLASAAAGCGDGDDAPDADLVAAQATVKRYFTALGKSDGAAACRAMTVHSRGQLAEVGREALKVRRATCSRTMETIFASVAGPGLRRLADAKITDARRRGDTVRVKVRGVGTTVTLVQEAGEWRIRSRPALDEE